MRDEAPFPISAIQTPSDIDMIGTPIAGVGVGVDEGGSDAAEEEDGLFAGGDDEEEEAEAGGSSEPKEEIKIPETTLEPDLQTFCKLIFNSE